MADSRLNKAGSMADSRYTKAGPMTDSRFKKNLDSRSTKAGPVSGFHVGKGWPCIRIPGRKRLALCQDSR